MIKQKKLKNFNRLTDNNLGYMVECKYNTFYPCQAGSDCCDNDYCRCGVIKNACVPSDVNNSYLIAIQIIKNQDLIKDFRFYCLERLISYMLRGNPGCFDVSIGGGYYGEEVHGVSLDWNVLATINNFVEQLNKPKTKAHYRDLVEQVLSAEYGHVLPAIVGKNWEYERVSTKNIRRGNDNYRNISHDTVNQYADTYRRSKYLSCLCKKTGPDEFTLVDGYHRFTAAEKRGDKSIMVMWCKA